MLTRDLTLTCSPANHGAAMHSSNPRSRHASGGSSTSTGQSPPQSEASEPSRLSPMSVVERQSSEIWAQPWTPPIISEDDIVPIYDIKARAFEEASAGVDFDSFQLRGCSVRELIKALCSALETSVEEGDFTSILSSNRDFIMYVLILFHCALP